MVKEVEKAGFPIVQMCNLVPVAKTVGSNRIVPTISIPYPLGDPDTPKESSGNYVITEQKLLWRLWQQILKSRQYLKYDDCSMI